MANKRKIPNEKGEYKCSGCKKWLHPEFYSKNKSQTSGFHYECRSCNRLRGRDINLKNKYGISSDEVRLMLESQNNKCSICEVPIQLSIDSNKSNYSTRANVDHCHSTKKIRGVLCTLCNMGLGKFKDNILRLEKAINYLKKDC